MRIPTVRIKIYQYCYQTYWGKLQGYFLSIRQIKVGPRYGGWEGPHLVNEGVDVRRVHGKYQILRTAYHLPQSLTVPRRLPKYLRRVVSNLQLELVLQEL